MSVVRASSNGVDSDPGTIGKYASQSTILAGNTAIPDVPDRPTIGTATDIGTSRAFNNGAATVTATASATGGVPSSYTVTSSPGGFNATSTSPVTVTGLQSGTSYTFTAVANTTTGSSPATASASNSITATTVPNNPTIGTATNLSSGRAYNDGRIDVAFTAPNTGGKAITGYTASSSPAGFIVGGAGSPISVTGLPSSTQYSFTVTATNANGNSNSSVASNLVTTTTVPQAPTINSVTRTSSTVVTLSYTAGATGGSAITSYTVTSSPSISLSYNASNPTTLTGTYALDQAYTFTMTATNANGTSLSSNTSTSIVPNFSPGNQTFLSSGTFTVPPGVTSISAVAIGGGESGTTSESGGDGGNAGSLRYATSIAVTSGESLTISVGTGGAAGTTTKNPGGQSSISRGATALLVAGGGANTSGQSTIAGNIGGGNGGAGSNPASNISGGGGGTGGYSGNGTAGGTTPTAPTAGTGAAIGSANVTTSGASSTVPNPTSFGFPAAGVGPWGLGYTGTSTSTNFRNGSGGFLAANAGSTSAAYGKMFGGGGGSQDSLSSPAPGASTLIQAGGDGVVRIIWGDGRSYPSTNVTFTPILVGYVSGTNTGTSAISYPAGTQDGDYIIFGQSNGAGSATPTVPSGFTGIRASTGQLRSSSPSSMMCAKFRSGENSMTPATSVAATTNYMLAVFRNVYVDATNSFWGGNLQLGKNFALISTYHTAVSSTTTGLPTIAARTNNLIQVANALSVNFAVIDDVVVSGIAAPSGWTLVGVQQSSTTTGGASMMAYKIHSSENDTTIAAAYTGTGSDSGASLTVTLRPGEAAFT